MASSSPDIPKGDPRGNRTKVGQDPSERDGSERKEGTSDMGGHQRTFYADLCWDEYCQLIARDIESLQCRAHIYFSRNRANKIVRSDLKALQLQ